MNTVNDNLTVRLCDQSDLKDVFVWENDPISLKMSFSQKEIVWDDHIKWFEKFLKKKNNIMVIGELFEKKIGLVKYKISRNRAVCSVNISPSFRGKGLSSSLLIKSEKFINVKINTLTAKVKKKNIISEKSFIKAGYSLQKFCNELFTFKKIINK